MNKLRLLLRWVLVQLGKGAQYERYYAYWARDYPISLFILFFAGLAVLFSSYLFSILFVIFLPLSCLGERLPRGSETKLQSDQ